MLVFFSRQWQDPFVRHIVASGTMQRRAQCSVGHNTASGTMQRQVQYSISYNAASGTLQHPAQCNIKHNAASCIMQHRVQYCTAAFGKKGKFSCPRNKRVFRKWFQSRSSPSSHCVTYWTSLKRVTDNNLSACGRPFNSYTVSTSLAAFTEAACEVHHTRNLTRSFAASNSLGLVCTEVLWEIKLSFRAKQVTFKPDTSRFVVQRFSTRSILILDRKLFSALELQIVIKHYQGDGQYHPRLCKWYHWM